MLRLPNYVVYIGEKAFTNTKGGFDVEDRAIIQLYHDRDESAIEESKRKYSGYCMSIALRILENKEDAEECVNDTWLRAWNAMPPEHPQVLSAYLGAITRHIAFDRYKQKRRQKRGNGETAIALDEIEAVFSFRDDPETAYSQKELKQSINNFLSKLPTRERDILVLRYYFVYPVSQIAERYRLSESHVRTILSRTLQKLKKHLEKEKLYER